MVLALAAFGRLWCVTHQPHGPKGAVMATPVDVQFAAPDAGFK